MATIIRQVCMSRMGPPRSTSQTVLPVLASVEVCILEWNRLFGKYQTPLTPLFLASILLTVSSEFQTHPSLMARQVSLDAMRLLRLNVALSHSIQQARQAAAVMSTPSAFGVAQSMPNHTSSVGSFNQWSFMASSPSVMLDPSTNRDSFAVPFPCAMTSPAMGAQTRLESSSHHTKNPIIQYLQQQQVLNRDGARHYESGRHGMNVSTSPPPLSISQDLSSSHVVGTHLPAVLSCSTDGIVLTKFQVFLRLHIEAFAATPHDVSSRIRGRHKQVRLHQVGIQCRHCAHIPASQRGKGAVYFPSSTMGLYQAAQNMNSTHLQCGLCPEMPESTKTAFAQLLGTKTAGSSSAGGRAYWGRCALQIGLVDTEHGIFAVGAIPEGTSAI
jgi:hypothetical protein